MIALTEQLIQGLMEKKLVEDALGKALVKLLDQARVFDVNVETTDLANSETLEIKLSLDSEESIMIHNATIESIMLVVYTLQLAAIATKHMDNPVKENQFSETQTLLQGIIMMPISNEQPGEIGPIEEKPSAAEPGNDEADESWAKVFEQQRLKILQDADTHRTEISDYIEDLVTLVPSLWQNGRLAVKNLESLNSAHGNPGHRVQILDETKGIVQYKAFFFMLSEMSEREALAARLIQDVLFTV